MTGTPERIWAWQFMPSKQTEEMKGGWIDAMDKRETEYIRRDAVYDLPEVKALVEAAIALRNDFSLFKFNRMGDFYDPGKDAQFSEFDAALDAIKAKP